jgi:hypothetical protein
MMTLVMPLLIVVSLVLLLAIRSALSDSYHSPAVATLLAILRGAAIITVSTLILWWSWDPPSEDLSPVNALILMDEVAGVDSDPGKLLRELKTVVHSRNGRLISLAYNSTVPVDPGISSVAERPFLSFRSFPDTLPLIRWLIDTNPELSVAVISSTIPDELRSSEFDGIALSWVPPGKVLRRDPVKSIVYPRAVFTGQRFTINVGVRPVPQQHEIVLSVNDTPIENRLLASWEQEPEDITFGLRLDTPGINSAKLSILRKDGQILAQHSLPVRCLPVPEILYFSPRGKTSPLAQHLNRKGLSIRHLSLQDIVSGNLPENPSPEKGGLIILDSAPASYFNRSLVASLSDAVARLGYKLLILPGSDVSPRDRGGPVEKILPVKFGIEESDDPGTDLAFVAIVDTSLSMFFNTKGISTFAHGGGAGKGFTTKIDMAKKAINNLADAIDESDRLGVLTVTDRPSWVIKPSEPRKIDQEKEIIRRISALGPGINLYSGLLAAYNELASLNSDLKHILIFLDTADVDEYQVADRGTVWELLELLKDQGITVSLIGFGKAGDAHIPQLNRFAEEAGGYFYLTSDIEQIPGFGLIDLEQVADSLLNFQARKVNFFPSDFPGIKSFPDLKGQVVTTLKPGASLYAWSDRELPLFAAWPVGLGKVGIFTADGGQVLARGWSDEGKDSAPWLTILAKLMSEDQPTTNIFYTASNGSGTVHARSAGPDIAEGLEVRTTYLDGSRRSLPMEKVGPDLLQTSFSIVEQAPDTVELVPSDTGRRLAYQVVPAFRVPISAHAFTSTEFEPIPFENSSGDNNRFDPIILRLLILLVVLLVSVDEFFRPPSPEN